MAQTACVNCILSNISHLIRSALSDLHLGCCQWVLGLHVHGKMQKNTRHCQISGAKWASLCVNEVVAKVCMCWPHVDQHCGSSCVCKVYPLHDSTSMVSHQCAVTVQCSYMLRLSAPLCSTTKLSKTGVLIAYPTTSNTEWLRCLHLLETDLTGHLLMYKYLQALLRRLHMLVISGLIRWIWQDALCLVV